MKACICSGLVLVLVNGSPTENFTVRREEIMPRGSTRPFPFVGSG